MSILLAIHLLAIGIWLGVVGAEFAIEIAGMKNDEELKRASLLHYQTDIWVEIPAFLTVLATGFLMLEGAQLEGVILAKVIFGLLAVMFNLIAVYAVFVRRKKILSGDMDGLGSVQRAMRISSLVIPCFVIALALGFYSLVAG